MTEKIPENIVLKKASSFIDDDKNTPLHYAAAYGKLQDVKSQFGNGYEIDPINYLGWTPLMMAIRYGHFDVIQFLLEKSADSTKKNDFGFNILLLAISSGSLDVVHLILQHLLYGGISRQNLQSFFSPISLSVLFNNIGMVQYLADKGFCVNAESPLGITPLMFATAKGNLEIANLLISRGAKIKNQSASNDETENQHHQHFIQSAQPSDYIMPLAPPLVLVNPASPFIHQQPILNHFPNMSLPRKSSNVESPCFTPNLSPFPFVPQVFFPSQYSPNHYFSNVPVFSSPEYLNLRITPYCSPVPVTYLPIQ